ncbi:MAG: hypothetical protein MUC33_13525 [Desulfobacterales bacterium]|jgi:hypothetical protein|nr:hypothetical protein [Desulfobacterales bacterium]
MAKDTDPNPVQPPLDEGRGGPARRRWTVLFIGDHGKVVAFKRIKTVVGLTLAALVAALAAVAVLLVVNQRLHGRGRDLQQRLEESRRQIESLSHEKDLLTAHVFLVETKMKETLSGVGRPAGDLKRTPAEPEKRAASTPPPTEAAAEENADGAAETASPGPEARPPINSGDAVAVEGFGAKYNPVRQSIDIKYKLVASSPGRKPVAGHVIVVFKGERVDPEAWLAMPRVELPKGRPSGAQKGYTFSISHSKAFAQTLPVPKSIPGFTTAVLYVFSHEGQLMLAREYAVALQPSGG